MLTVFRPHRHAWRSAGLGIIPLVFAFALAACNGTTSPESVPESTEVLEEDGALTAAQVDTVAVVHSSGYSEPAREVLETEEEWRETWDRMHAGVSPPPERPEVDLEASIVVVLAMGTRPTGGYGIGVSAARVVDGDLELEVEERSPGASCGVTQAITSPTLLIQLPVPSGEVEFSEREVTRDC